MCPSASTTAKARSQGFQSPDVIKIPTLGLGTTRLFHHDGAMKGNGHCVSTTGQALSPDMAWSRNLSWVLSMGGRSTQGRHSLVFMARGGSPLMGVM